VRRPNAGNRIGHRTRRAFSFVCRSHRQGRENPADSQVQAPTKYGLAINFKAAKVLGLEVPPALLARADDMIK
jgi:putative tryptophan/tyrosine transport system substrate-binding protein